MITTCPVVGERADKTSIALTAQSHTNNDQYMCAVMQSSGDEEIPTSYKHVYADGASSGHCCIEQASFFYASSLTTELHPAVTNNINTSCMVCMVIRSKLVGNVLMKELFEPQQNCTHMGYIVGYVRASMLTHRSKRITHSYATHLLRKQWQ